MVGIFSKLSVDRPGHGRTQSALDVREVVRLLPSNSEVSSAAATATAATSVGSIDIHGIEVPVELKPVEHPTEPPDNDQPIQCPLPEPSILNDGRIWKERASAGMMTRGDTMEGTSLQSAATTAQPVGTNRMILPSVSAPEHHLVSLLEECNAPGF